MHIKIVEKVPHPRGHGIAFSNLDEVASAIKKLGHMWSERLENVEVFIEQVRQESKQPGLLRAIKHLEALEHVDRHNTVIASEGYRFFVHNDEFQQQRPFQDLRICVYMLTTSERRQNHFLLKVTDKPEAVWQQGLTVPNNHTDSWLSYELFGHERPLRQIEMVAAYQPMGRAVEFDIAPLLEALNDIKGIKQVNLEAREIARSFYQQLVQPKITNDSFVVRFNHNNGASICLEGFFGIRVVSKIPNEQVELHGSIIRGPLNNLFRNPYVRFTVNAGEWTTNDQLNELAEELEAKLRAHDN